MTADDSDRNAGCLALLFVALIVIVGVIAAAVMGGAA